MTTRAVLTAAVLATSLMLTACGGGDSTTTGNENAPTTSTAATGSAPGTPSSPASASTSAGDSGTAPAADEKAWVEVLKKTMPALASTSDAEILTQAKKVCTDFKANPTNAGANAGVKEIESAFGLDSTFAKVFATASITQYCNDQSEAYMKASIAG
ncbi:MAG: DUF732 domain-containing protein [Tetrasphaera sp.]|nr:DUF732 domain-containing protein [Tetrasphaera sp.]